MSDHLGLGLKPGQCKRAAERTDPVPTVENKAAHVRKATPGDHLEKLKPETIERLNAIFAEELAYFDYPEKAVAPV